MPLRVYLKVYETAAVSFVLSGGRMLLLMRVRSDLILQHERELWIAYLQLDPFLSEHLQQVRIGRVGNNMFQVSLISVLPLFSTIEPLFVYLPEGMNLHTFSPGP